MKTEYFEEQHKEQKKNPEFFFLRRITYSFCVPIIWCDRNEYDIEFSVEVLWHLGARWFATNSPGHQSLGRMPRTKAKKPICFPGCTSVLKNT